MEEKQGNQQYRQRNLFPEEDLRPSNRGEDSEADQEAEVILALSEQQGIGFKSIREFYNAGGIASFSKWDDTRLMKELGECLHQPTSEQVKDITKNRTRLKKEGRSRLKELNDRGVSLITENHSGFPSRVSERMEEAPKWLFVKGNIGVLKNTSMVGLVGTREPSKQGEWLAERCSMELAKRNFVVLSGLAQGIDSASHSGAVKTYAQTVAVLGHGIEESFLSGDQPSLSEKMLELDGAVVSEYLPNDPPSREGYLRRNEVVSALSGLIIPVECPSLQSGTGSTIRRAQQIGTPVAGIKPANGSEPNKALLRTEENLESIEIPVLSVFSRNREFWNFLEEQFPNHHWSKNKERHERFYQLIAKKVRRADNYLKIEEDDLNRMIEVIKKELNNG